VSVEIHTLENDRRGMCRDREANIRTRSSGELRAAVAAIAAVCTDVASLAQESARFDLNDWFGPVLVMVCLIQSAGCLVMAKVAQVWRLWRLCDRVPSCRIAECDVVAVATAGSRGVIVGAPIVCGSLERCLQRGLRLEVSASVWIVAATRLQ